MSTTSHKNYSHTEKPALPGKVEETRPVRRNFGGGVRIFGIVDPSIIHAHKSDECAILIITNAHAQPLIYSVSLFNANRLHKRATMGIIISYIF
jgi:hypothetical protein